jgi:hypothetical protein
LGNAVVSHLTCSSVASHAVLVKGTAYPAGDPDTVVIKSAVVLHGAAVVAEYSSIVEPGDILLDDAAVSSVDPNTAYGDSPVSVGGVADDGTAAWVPFAHNPVPAICVRGVPDDGTFPVTIYPVLTVESGDVVLDGTAAYQISIALALDAIITIVARAVLLDDTVLILAIDPVIIVAAGGVGDDGTPVPRDYPVAVLVISGTVEVGAVADDGAVIVALYPGLTVPVGGVVLDGTAAFCTSILLPAVYPGVVVAVGGVLLDGAPIAGPDPVGAISC